MRKLLNSIVFLFFPLFICLGQSPKREVRATWLTTVWRIDWPSQIVPRSTGGNEVARQKAIQAQKDSLISIFDRLQASNINAAFFQVRSMCDAFYESSYEPWSSFVSEVRGDYPGYDPLAFAIEEAHKRGIELHAWLNPYRYSTSQGSHGETSIDYSKTHPEWLLDYENYKKILNPGLPEVVLQIKKVVAEIVQKYDVDGIIFDDYFYAYGGTSSSLDSATQDLYKPQGQSVGDWRRKNVNKMIAAVYDTIQVVKPYVRFGVSPFGTWTTNKTVAARHGLILPLTNTANMYEEIYCDPIAWLEEGTVDYISPQLYWTTYSPYPYGVLADWWSKVALRFGKHFYSSHSLSAMTPSSYTSTRARKTNNAVEEAYLKKIGADFLSPIECAGLKYDPLSDRREGFSLIRKKKRFTEHEVGKQIDFNRSTDLLDAPGSVFYSTKRALNSSFLTYLKQNKFTHKALVPSVGWKKAPVQSMVENISLSGKTLTWTYNDPLVCYTVYLVPNSEINKPTSFSTSTYLQGVAYGKQFSFPETTNLSSKKIAVAVLDRYGNEFSPRIMGEPLGSIVSVNLIAPANNSSLVFPLVFKCDAVEGAFRYVLELARDENFNDLLLKMEANKPEFTVLPQIASKDIGNYFWRVRVHKKNASESSSSVWSFSARNLKITSPENGNQYVDEMPLFKWDNLSSSAIYTLEISKVFDFVESGRVYKKSVQTNSLSIPSGILESSTNYYARVSVKYDDIEFDSEIIKFKTWTDDVPIPQIIQPVNGDTLQGKTIQVCWTPQASKGFKVELSNSTSFPPRTTKIQMLAQTNYCTTYENVKPGTYFIRMSAETATGFTDYTNTLKIVLNQGTNINNLLASDFNCYVRTIQEEKDLIINTNIACKSEITIYSLMGMVMWKKNIDLTSEENIISLNDKILLHGIYIVEIKTERHTSFLKFIY